jgi:membrane protease YdiL (CAAX protease family)
MKRWSLLVGLYLGPGVLIGAFYFLVGPWLIELGYTGLMALVLAIALVLIPVQLGILWFQKNDQGDRLLVAIWTNQKPVTLKWMVLYVVGLILFAGLVFGLLSSTLNAWLKEEVFVFLPEWAKTMTVPDESPQKVVTILLFVLFGNILGPLVEELYFRGYLLAKTPGTPVTRSVLNAFLFALYHVWSPWDILARTISLSPYAFVTIKEDNLWMSTFAHIGVNMLSSMAIIAMLF